MGCAYIFRTWCFLPVVTAQLILKVGIATSMLMGINLLVSNEIDLLTFIVFMVVVTRIFDPVAGALINLAGTFHSLISIERIKKLEATKFQTGKDEFNPKGYDINFKNVKFSYNDDKNVIDNVDFVVKQGEITALAGPSGGERQRLSIARALLKDAPIVLLDEATSSLDIQSESAVQSAIHRLTKDKTVIVIAHRMRTIAGADKIILLEGVRFQKLEIIKNCLL